MRRCFLRIETGHGVDAFQCGFKKSFHEITFDRPKAVIIPCLRQNLRKFVRWLCWLKSMFESKSAKVR